MHLLSGYRGKMAYRHGNWQFLDILLVCLYTLLLVSSSTGTASLDANDGLSKRMVIISAQQESPCPHDCAHQDLHPTLEKTVPEESVHGVPSPELKPKHQATWSRRKRRSAVSSSGSGVGDGSLDSRRKLYNDFLRKVLRRNRQRNNKKEKDVMKLEEKSKSVSDRATAETSVTTSPTPSENRVTSLRNAQQTQTIETDLTTDKTSPRPLIRRGYTLSPEQRERSRQILLKRNKEERLRRLRELHYLRNATLSPKSSTKNKNKNERVHTNSRPRLSAGRKGRPKLNRTTHRTGDRHEHFTQSTINLGKNGGGEPKIADNHSNRPQVNKNDMGIFSVQRSTDSGTNQPAPGRVNPFISASRANDYLTRFDSIAKTKKYPRRVSPAKEKASSSTPTANSSRSKLERNTTLQEKRLKKRKKGNNIVSTGEAESTPRRRKGKHSFGPSTRISKSEKKRIKRIRQNRLKLKQRKRRNKRKRKHRKRKNRSRHKIVFPSTVPRTIIMTSTSRNPISSNPSNDFSSTNEHRQTSNNNKKDTPSTSVIFRTTVTLKTTLTTSRPVLEVTKEFENIRNNFNESSAERASNISNEFAAENATTAFNETAAEKTGYNELNATSAPLQRNLLNMRYNTISPSSIISSNVSTAKTVYGETSKTYFSQSFSTESDVRNHQEQSNETRYQLYNSSGSLINSLHSNESTTTIETQTGNTGRYSTTKSSLPLSAITTSIFTSSSEQHLTGTTVNTTTGTSLFTGDFFGMTSTPVSLSSSSSSSISERKSPDMYEQEKELSSKIFDEDMVLVPHNNGNNHNIKNDTGTQISSSTVPPKELASEPPSPTPLLSSSLHFSTTSSYANRWIAWAQRRRKKSKNKSKSRKKKGKQSSTESTVVSEGSVALALAKGEKEDNLRQSVSSRRPITEPRTTKGPFIGYKTAYDFLSNQNALKVNVLNENRRESRDINRFMGESMCEIFNKHYVPTRIGGKCV